MRIFRSKFLKDNSGVAAIEFALILPVFIALMFGVIEFGIYLVKEQLVTNAVNTSSIAIQQNPSGFTHDNAIAGTILKLVGRSVQKASVKGCGIPFCMVGNHWSKTTRTPQ